MLSCAGFVLPPPGMLGWASWMRRFAPPAWALEALLGNEFRVRSLMCGATDMVPNGPQYTDPAFQTCSITGSAVGARGVSGVTYIQLTYGYSPSHIWRNVGIIWGTLRHPLELAVLD